MTNAKVKTSTNSNADLLVTLGETTYTFRQPKGRDLVAIERISGKPDSTDTETLAVVMATLSDKDQDYYLDLPLATFKKVGKEVMEYFRLSSED